MRIVSSLPGKPFALQSSNPPETLPSPLAPVPVIAGAKSSWTLSRLQPKLPRDLETLGLKCREKDPAQRYATAGELAEELGRFLRHEPIRARPLGRMARLVRWCRRNPALSASAGWRPWRCWPWWRFPSGSASSRPAPPGTSTALDEARRLSASSTFERGLSLCEQGDVDRGMLWMARGLEISSRSDATAPFSVSSGQTWPAGLSGSIPCGTAWNTAIVSRPYCLQPVRPGDRDRQRRSDRAALGRGQRPPPRPAAAPPRPGDASEVQPRRADAPDRRRDRSGRSLEPDRSSPVNHPLEHPGALRDAAFSPDGRLVPTGKADGNARLWETASALRAGAPLMHQGEVNAVAFSPDGRFALTAGSLPVAQLWEMPADDYPASAHFSFESWLYAMAFSSDGRFIVLGGGDSSARVFEVTTGRAIGGPLRHDDDMRPGIHRQREDRRLGGGSQDPEALGCR